MSDISWVELIQLYKNEEDEDQKNDYLFLIRDKASEDSKFAQYARAKGIHI